MSSDARNSRKAPSPAKPSLAASIETQNIAGTSVALIDYDRAMDVMDAMITEHSPGYIVAAAVHALMVAREDDEMRAALDEATLVVPDGMPIVWATRPL